MDDIQLEIAGYILLDKCKCCLGDGQMKNFWVEYCEDGKKEIYGEMLHECFDLTDNIEYNLETKRDTDKICESCIIRLRAALEFKQEVMACAQLRFEQLNNGFNLMNKEIEECVEESESLEDIDLDNENDPDPGCSKQPNFDVVEYLEVDDDDVIEVKATVATNSPSKKKNTVQSNTKKESTVTRAAEKKKKWPKKKQYIRADILKAMEMVQRGLLSAGEAAKKFKVPKKTLTTKLLLARRKTDEDDEANSRTKKIEDHYQFIEEVKKILTYTNAVPFKTKASRYFCTYCSTDGPCFEEPDQLRAHTRTEHVDYKMRNIEMVLRRQSLNEVIKMDIDSLHCTVCCTIIPVWSEMFIHLEESHSIVLDEAYTKVIPYILKRDLTCALCNESFPNFHHLDGHMNSHYASYICQECGDTFLSASRLHKHLKVHNTGRYPCDACGKVFAREWYRQKHFDHVHKQEHNVKCLYCPEKFYGTFQRHLHMVEKHKEKVSITTCELCGMRFEWRRYYVAHMRRKHNIRTI